MPAQARLYALLMPSGHAAGLVADIRAAATYEPVLLTHLDRRVGAGGGHGERAPVRKVAEGGRETGWEVLGYDHGVLHTWLCNDLYRDAVRDLGVEGDERGLLPDGNTAERVAAWANARDDTKPVTWFPAALLEWDTPVESRFVPITATTPPPRPWWHRLTLRVPPASRGRA